MLEICDSEFTSERLQRAITSKDDRQKLGELLESSGGIRS